MSERDVMKHITWQRENRLREANHGMVQDELQNMGIRRWWETKPLFEGNE